MWLGEDREQWLGGDTARELVFSGLPGLAGRDLMCWCLPAAPCHADILLEWANLPAGAIAERIVAARARVDRHRAWRGEDPMYEQKNTDPQVRIDVGEATGDATTRRTDMPSSMRPASPHPLVERFITGFFRGAGQTAVRIQRWMQKYEATGFDDLARRLDQDGMHDAARQVRRFARTLRRHR